MQTGTIHNVFHCVFCLSCTGLYKRSVLRKTTISGEVLQETKFKDTLFGEGNAIVGDKLFAITWRCKVLSHIFFWVHFYYFLSENTLALFLTCYLLKFWTSSALTQKVSRRAYTVIFVVSKLCFRVGFNMERIKSVDDRRE